MLAILDRLPERSRAGHPVKAFATLAAELGIRRETMDKLEVPKHYEPGAEFLRVSADIDKEGRIGGGYETVYQCVPPEPRH